MKMLNVSHSNHLRPSPVKFGTIYKVGERYLSKAGEEAGKEGKVWIFQAQDGSMRRLANFLVVGEDEVNSYKNAMKIIPNNLAKLLTLVRAAVNNEKMQWHNVEELSIPQQKEADQDFETTKNLIEKDKVMRRTLSKIYIHQAFTENAEANVPSKVQKYLSKL